MQCENCDLNHDGKFGSGRFCTQKCARAFSTKSKRDFINEKVSSTLKGMPSKLKGRPGHTHTKDSRAKISEGVKKHYEEHPEKILSTKQRKANNVAKVIAYRAKQRDAILETSDLELIKLIYENCPEGYEVDHIKSLATGGNHHQDNLQYLPIAENRKKGANDSYDKSLVIDWKDILNNK